MQKPKLQHSMDSALYDIMFTYKNSYYMDENVLSKFLKRSAHQLKLAEFIYIVVCTTKQYKSLSDVLHVWDCTGASRFATSAQISLK